QAAEAGPRGATDEVVAGARTQVVGALHPIEDVAVQDQVDAVVRVEPERLQAAIPELLDAVEPGRAGPAGDEALHVRVAGGPAELEAELEAILDELLAQAGGEAPLVDLPAVVTVIVLIVARPRLVQAVLDRALVGDELHVEMELAVLQLEPEVGGPDVEPAPRVGVRSSAGGAVQGGAARGAATGARPVRCEALVPVGEVETAVENELALGELQTLELGVHAPVHDEVVLADVVLLTEVVRLTTVGREGRARGQLVGEVPGAADVQGQ